LHTQALKARALPG